MKIVTLLKLAYVFQFEVTLWWTSLFCDVNFCVEERTQDEYFSCISFFQQEHEPELQPAEKASSKTDKGTEKSKGKSWV